MEPIGYLESCYPDKFGTPRQPGLVASSWARLRVLPQYQPEQAFVGLEGFSHIWLIFQFHKNTNLRYHAKVHPPRMGGESIGVFASRSPHRPNPIGLSLVELEKIESDCLILRGADLIDGTPILDIKPYLPDVESKALARSGWTQLVSPNLIEVLFTPTQLEVLQSWSLRIGQPNLRSIIEQTLCLDPRPLVYKKINGESNYRSSHAVRFFDGDVHFKFIESNKIEIVDIRIG